MILNGDENLIRAMVEGVLSDSDCFAAEERFKDAEFNYKFAEAAGEERTAIIKSVLARVRPVDHVANEELVLSKDGSVKNTSVNYVRILSKDNFLYGKIRYNALDGRISINGVPWGLNSHPMRDVDLNQIRAWISENYGLDDIKRLISAVSVVADNHKFHPIVNKLESLSWDGKSRFAEFLPRYLGAERSDYTTAVTKLLFLAACNRVIHPGIKFDSCGILADTKQGTGKSTIVRLMALNDEWFGDSLEDLGDSKKSYEAIRGRWIIEIGEMIATRRTKDVESTKGFLSRTHDVYRDPYGVFPEHRPRQCIFIGTTNKPQFLPDDRTGNRRFLPIICDGSKAVKHPLEDESETRQFIEQCYAEAMTLIRESDCSLILDSRFNETLNEIRENSSPEDSKIGVIQAWLDESTDKDLVCSRMIFEKALNNEEREPKNYELQEIADIMNLKIVGWERFRGKDGQGKSAQYRFKDYGRQRAWCRIKEKNVNGREGASDDNRAEAVDNEAQEDGFLTIDDSELGIFG